MKEAPRSVGGLEKKTGRTASGTDAHRPLLTPPPADVKGVEPTAEFNLEDITAMYARRSADRADEREFTPKPDGCRRKRIAAADSVRSEAPLREAPPPHRAAPHTPMLHAHPPLRMPHGGAAYQMLTPQAIQARAAQDGRRAVLPCREAQDDRLRVQPNQAAGTEMSAHPRPAPHRPIARGGFGKRTDRTRGRPRPWLLGNARSEGARSSSVYTSGRQNRSNCGAKRRATVGCVIWRILLCTSHRDTVHRRLAARRLQYSCERTEQNRARLAGSCPRFRRARPSGCRGCFSHPIPLRR